MKWFSILFATIYLPLLLINIGCASAVEDPVTVTAIESRAIATVTIVADVRRQQTVPATEAIYNSVPDEATTATQTPTAVGTRRPSATPNRTATPTPLPVETVAIIRPTPTPFPHIRDETSEIAMGVTGHILYVEYRDFPSLGVYIEEIQDLWKNEVRSPTRLVEGFEARYSREAGKIAFTSKQDGDYDIYIISVQDTEVTQITNNDRADFSPVWSPDGKKIIYTADTEYGLQIFVYDIELATNTQLTTFNGNIFEPDWSPDGSAIVFSAQLVNEEPTEIYLLDLDGGNNVIQLTDIEYGVARRPRWSPDGQTIAYLSNYAIEVDLIDGYEVEGEEVHLLQPSTGESRRLTRVEDIQGIFAPPIWSPDGRYLLVESLTEAVVYVVDVETGYIVELVDTYLHVTDWFILDN